MQRSGEHYYHDLPLVDEMRLYDLHQPQPAILPLALSLALVDAERIRLVRAPIEIGQRRLPLPCPGLLLSLCRVKNDRTMMAKGEWRPAGARVLPVPSDLASRNGQIIAVRSMEKHVA